MSGGIHILKGTGRNCTCGDCAVLYGGSCGTTKDNDFMDRVESIALKQLGSKTYVCKSDIHRFLEAIRPVVRKRYKWTNAQYDKHYYTWSPFLYMNLGYREDKGKRYEHWDARRAFRRARLWVLWDIEKQFKTEK